MQHHQEEASALLAPTPVASGSSWRAAAAFGTAAFLAFGVGFGLTPRAPSSGVTAYTRADLGPNLVTPIDPADPAAMARAQSQLHIDDGERQQVSAELHSGRIRLGLMAFFDDADPDGDAIAVQGAGFHQRVPLNADLSLVVVPYAIGGPIEVTAVSDGGDVATVALMTAAGPIHLKRLRLGETIGIATP